jgi:hypothetical protein
MRVELAEVYLARVVGAREEWAEYLGIVPETDDAALAVLVEDERWFAAQGDQVALEGLQILATTLREEVRAATPRCERCGGALDITSTLIGCRDCGTVWGRCNGAWR